MSAQAGGGLGTLTVLYDEARRSLDQQIALVESLNNRAQQILGFSIVIVSVIAAVDLREGNNWVKGLGLASLGLFVIAAVLGFVAWRFQTYRDDPDPASLYGRYRNADEEAIRDQVVGNRLAAIRTNADIIGRKRKWINGALWTLVAGVGVLVVLVTVRAFSADPIGQPARVPWHHGKEDDQEERYQAPGRSCRPSSARSPAHEESHCWWRHRERG